MKDFMIDLESLGTQPDSCFFSIGGVFFDRYTGVTGRGFYVLINPECPHNAIRHRSQATKAWWAEQPEEARQEYDKACGTGGQYLHGALYMLGKTLNLPDLQVWANGTTFDISALEHAYRQVDLPCPWRYNAMRDMRTLRELGLADPSEIPDSTVAHHALHDAIWQAKYTALVFQRLGTLKGPRGEGDL